MDVHTDSSIESPRGSNNSLVHSLSSLRGHFGGWLTSSKPIEALLSSSKNNAEDVGFSANNSFIERRVFRTCSLTTQQQLPMQTSNPLFESEILRTQKLLSRSFDVGLWKAKSMWDEESGGLSPCESTSSIDQRHWKALLAFRSRLLFRAANKDDPSEPTSSLTYVPQTPRRNDTVLNSYNDGTKSNCCLSSYSYGKDESIKKTTVKSNVVSEGHRGSKHAKNGRFLFQYSPRGVHNKDQSIAFQNDKSRRSQSRTRPPHKTETKRQRRSADSTRVATTKPYTVNDPHGTLPFSNTEDNEHNNFRRLKRKTNSSQDDQPTIAQLWAQESQNNTSFRRYRGNLYKPPRERSGSDHEAYFHLIDLGSHTKKSLKVVKNVRGLLRFTNRGMSRSKSEQEFREQRSRLLALAAIPFDHSNDRHVAILQEIYRIYTGNQGDNVEIIGDHWKELGFRGPDPALELRSGGILTLLFLLYFHKKDPLAATAIFHESKREGGVYPFASMCVVVTTWVLRAIQKRKFKTIVKDMEVNNKEWIENKEERLMLAAKKLFTGLIYKFHWNVTRRQGGIIALLEVSEQVQKEMKKDVEIVLRIADLPDILQLGEHLFKRLTRFQQIKQTIKLTFTCFQPKDLSSVEEHS